MKSAGVYARPASTFAISRRRTQILLTWARSVPQTEVALMNGNIRWGRPVHHPSLAFGKLRFDKPETSF